MCNSVTSCKKKLNIQESVLKNNNFKNHIRIIKLPYIDLMFNYHFQLDSKNYASIVKIDNLNNT
jgi:hypothetical protein